MTLLVAERHERPWSIEAGLLLRPASVYRELAQDGRGASLLRRPLLLAFVLGAGVSALASGRFSVRLIVDGAISFAFLPVIELASFAVVNAVGARRRMRFADAADLLFAGNVPWLLWLAAVAALFAAVDPRQIGPWLVPVLVGCLVPSAWSVWIDFHFFREVMQRPPAGAVRDLLLVRAICWLGALAYFFGIVAWSELPKLAQWAGR